MKCTDEVVEVYSRASCNKAGRQRASSTNQLGSISPKKYVYGLVAFPPGYLCLLCRFTPIFCHVPDPHFLCIEFES